jgi:trimeric autotransporter adhesin
VTTLLSKMHDAVTLGVTNWLSLSGQQLSLALASATTTGALSRADYLAFSGKQNALIAGAGISIAGNTISTTDNDSNNWLLGGNPSGGQVLGSTDAFLPFMSYGTVKMQLDDSNLSLSNNGSFVNNTGRNGLFIGDNNSYGNSNNVFALGDTLDIRDNNRNIITFGTQVDHIDNNRDSFFGGTTLSDIHDNIQVLAFGTDNRIYSNNQSILFGSNNTWSSEDNKFIVGNSDKKWFQVDMNNGEVQFSANPGTNGQVLVSGGAGTNPNWISLDTSMVSENPVNLYFTNARAQNALSGTIAGINTSIGTLSGQIATLSGNIATLSWNLATLSGVVATKIGLTSLSAVGPLTYNNLTGVFGINQATTSTPGFLSALDWNTFSSKENVLTFNNGLSRVGNTIGLVNGTNGQVLTMSGWAPVWVNPSAVSIPVSSVFGRTGAVIAQSGDYTTTQVTEWTNLYFTNARAIGSTLTGFSAASGTVVATDTILQALQKLQGSNTVQDGTIATLSWLAHSAVTIGTANGLSIVGQQLSLSLATATVTGSLRPADFVAFSGAVTQVATLSGQVNTLSGNLATTNANLATATGNIATLSWRVNTLSGIVTTNTTDITSLSWRVNTLSGSVSTLITNLNTTNTNLATATGQIATLSGQINTLSGNIATLSWNLATLSGVVATKIGLTSLSAVGPLTYNNTTGVFSIGNASATTTGALTGVDWATFNNKVGFISWTPNGLSITGTGISLALAGTSTTGALSATDWNTFNAKQSALTFGSISSATSGVTVTGGANSTVGPNVSISVAIASGTATGLLTPADFAAFSGKQNAIIIGSPANGLSLASNTLSLALASATVTGALSPWAFASFSGKQNPITLTTTGNNGASTWNAGTSTLNVPTYTLAGLGGISLTSLSATNGISYNNTTGAFTDLFTFNNGLSRVGNTVGLVNGTNGQVLTMVGGVPTWSTSGSAPVTSVFGRTGAVIAQSGDYTTTQVTEWTNLYFTNARADTILQALQKLQGSNTVQDSTIATISGLAHSAVTIGTANGLSLVGQQVSLALASSTVTGALSAADWNMFNAKQNAMVQATTTASGWLSSADWNTFNTKIGFISGTPNGLSITGTGISLGLAGTSTTGALSAIDWNAFNAKIGSINGLTGTTQTFAIGTNGTDFNIVSSGSVHTFNIPNASATARGLVSTGAQTFAWNKTFNGTTTMSGATVMAASTLANFAANGTIGTAAATVDAKTTFNINQTTANITLTLPNPTDTTAGRIAYVNNVGTTSFNLYGTQVWPGKSRTLIWNGTLWALTGNSDDRTSGQIRKAADEIVNNSNVAQNDDHLSFAVGANETWMFQIAGSVKNAGWATPSNLLLRMAIPAGSTNCSNTANSSYNGATVTNALCSTDLILTGINNYAATGNSDQFNYVWVFRVGATAGTAQFMWAQGTARAVATTIVKDTYINFYKLSGADLAEVYYSIDDSASEGDIVSLTDQWVSQVKKSSRAYDAKAIGIISTKPGLIMGEADGSGKPVVVGLAWRVPVKVTTKNGDIKPGDYIATSDIPGIGMRATEPGRVIGKALTGLSGVEQGTVVVFIENSYFDGVDEAEYEASLTSSGGEMSTTALDRFSYMVKRSLAKIDPNLIYSGSTVTTSLSGTTINVTANDTTDLTPLELEIATLSGQIAEMQSKIATYESLQSPMQYVSSSTGSTLSEEDITALSLIRGTIEWLFIDGRAVFAEMVTFTRDVVFESIVIFRDTVFFEARVVFSDPDMAGTAKIAAGSRRIHVDFQSPYAKIPVVTISPVWHYEQGTVANLTTTGFDIMVAASTPKVLTFNWMALIVTGASQTVWESPAEIDVEITPVITETPTPEIPPAPVDTATGDTVPSESSTGSEISDSTIVQSGSESPVSTLSLDEPLTPVLPPSAGVTPPEEAPLPAVETDPVTPELLPETLPVETVSWEASL